MDVAAHGAAEAPSRRDVEASGMDRALDHLAIQPPFREQHPGMGADIFGGIDAASNFTDPNSAPLVRQPDYFVLGDIANHRDPDPARR